MRLLLAATLVLLTTTQFASAGGPRCGGGGRGPQICGGNPGFLNMGGGFQGQVNSGVVQSGFDPLTFNGQIALQQNGNLVSPSNGQIDISGLTFDQVIQGNLLIARALRNGTVVDQTNNFDGSNRPIFSRLGTIASTSQTASTPSTVAATAGALAGSSNGKLGKAVLGEKPDGSFTQRREGQPDQPIEVVTSSNAQGFRRNSEGGFDRITLQPKDLVVRIDNGQPGGALVLLDENVRQDLVKRYVAADKTGMPKEQWDLIVGIRNHHNAGRTGTVSAPSTRAVATHNGGGSAQPNREPANTPPPSAFEKLAAEFKIDPVSPPNALDEFIKKPKWGKWDSKEKSQLALVKMRCVSDGKWSDATMFLQREKSEVPLGTWRNNFGMLPSVSAKFDVSELTDNNRKFTMVGQNSDNKSYVVKQDDTSYEIKLVMDTTDKTKVSKMLVKITGEIAGLPSTQMCESTGFVPSPAFFEPAKTPDAANSNLGEETEETGRVQLSSKSAGLAFPTFMKAKCVDCHTAPKAKKGLTVGDNGIVFGKDKYSSIKAAAVALATGLKRMVDAQGVDFKDQEKTELKNWISAFSTGMDDTQSTALTAALKAL